MQILLLGDCLTSNRNSPLNAGAVLLNQFNSFHCLLQRARLWVQISHGAKVIFLCYRLYSSLRLYSGRSCWCVWSLPPLNNKLELGGKPWSSGYGMSSNLKIMDSNLMCCKKLYCLLEKAENKRKGARKAHLNNHKLEKFTNNSLNTFLSKRYSFMDGINQNRPSFQSMIWSPFPQ